MITDRDIYQDKCKKMDPWCIDAYFDLKLDEDDKSKLVLEHSWGETWVDLEPAVKDAETITHLLLTESALQYNREDYGREFAPDGGIDCITGDALSRIISLTKLKDVNTELAVSDGDVYIFNEITNLFEPFQLKEFVNNTNKKLEELDGRVNTVENNLNALEQKVDNNFKSLTNAITNLTNIVNDLEARVKALEILTTRPANVPTDTVLTWGNINYYSDNTNTDKRTSGLFTHSTAITKVNDTKDA